MKTSITIILCLAFSFTLAQTVQQEIDKQVWTRFTTAWEVRDAAAFNAVHTQDIVRISSRGLLIGEEYFDRNRRTMVHDPNQSERVIEFAFDYRRANGNVAYEMGFYKVFEHDGMSPYVARFHVELRKVDGVWKIARDYDSDKIGNQSVNPAMYEELEFFHFE